MTKQTFTSGQVLSAAQMTTLQQTAMLGGAASAKVASYTLVAADAGDAITMSNAGATTITVNTGLFAAGDVVTILNLGAGACTITAGTATVTTSGSLVLAQNQGGILRFTSASAAVFLQFAAAAASTGANFTLLNAGGTALTGASTVTVSGISNQNQLMVIIEGGSMDFAQNRFGIQINGVTSSSYFQHRNINAYPASYSSGSYTGSSTTTTNIVMGLTGSSGGGTTVTAALNIFGGASSGLKIYSGFGIGNQSGGAGQEQYNVAGVLNTTTITSISAVSQGGSWDAGTLYIYGSA